MKFLNTLKTWLLVLIMVAMTSGAASGKSASGGINLSSGVSQSLAASKSLNALGLDDISTIGALGSPLATNKGGAKVGGGADLKNLSPGEQKRIQNAANKSGADITVVGSKTTGKRPGSDFDFILEGGTSRSRSRIKNSLPQGPRGTGEGNGRDFLKGPVDESLPHITFKPKPKG